METITKGQNQIIFPETVETDRLERLESIVTELSGWTVLRTIEITVKPEVTVVRFVDTDDYVRTFKINNSILKARVEAMKAEIEEIEERAIAHVEAKFNCEVIEVQVSGTKITAKVKENGIVRELNIFATINELRKPTGKERLAQAQSVSKEERIIRNLEQMRQAGVTLASRRPSIYLRSA